MPGESYFLRASLLSVAAITDGRTPRRFMVETDDSSTFFAPWSLPTLVIASDNSLSFPK